MVRVSGSLKERDGLPLLVISGNSSPKVEGYLLTFKSDSQEKVYRAICEFVPRKQYKWSEVSVPIDDALQSVNCLIGRKLKNGTTDIEDIELWSWKDDPLFRYGLREVKDFLDKYGKDEYQSVPPDSFEWSRFFRLQMAYFLLWSAIERYCAFAYGPQLDPGEKIKELGDDCKFSSFLSKVVSRKDKIFDSRDPTQNHKLDTSDALESIKYYYKVRSNLSHRGKAAWKDCEIVRQSLNELLNIISKMIAD